MMSVQEETHRQANGKSRVIEMSITSQIVSKFQQDYIAAPPFAPAFAADKRDAFRRKYNADAVFRKLMDEAYCYNKQTVFDFWLSSLELREFLREDLQNADVILVERDKASALSLKQVERALSEAKDAEEFKKLVLEERAAKANIWFELERKLDETRTFI